MKKEEGGTEESPEDQTGHSTVIVNGTGVIDAGDHAGALPGQRSWPPILPSRTLRSSP
jgi:hypothetical protein